MLHLLLSLLLVAVSAQELSLKLDVEHSFDGVTFSPRGSISINLSASAKSSLKFSDYTFSTSDLANLNAAAQNSKPYRIRFVNAAQNIEVGSFVPACALVASNLREQFLFHLSPSSLSAPLIAVDYSTVVSECPATLPTISEADSKLAPKSRISLGRPIDRFV